MWCGVYMLCMYVSCRYGIHEETMKDAGIFQRQKIELLTPGPAALPPPVSPPLPSSPSTGPMPTPMPGPSHPTSRSRSHSLDPLSPKVKVSRSLPAPLPHPHSDLPSGVTQPSTDTDTDTGTHSLSVSLPLPESSGGGGGGGPPRAHTTSSYSHLSEAQTQQHSGDLAMGMGGLAHATIIIHKLDASPPLQDCVWDRPRSSSSSSTSRLPLASAPDPSMIISQFAIYSINNCMLLTVSKDFLTPTAGGESGSCAEASSLPKEGTGNTRTGSNSTSTSSGSGSSGSSSSPWEDLKDRVRLADADVRVNSSSAKYLAFCAMVSLVWSDLVWSLLCVYSAERRRMCCDT